MKLLIKLWPIERYKCFRPCYVRVFKLIYNTDSENNCFTKRFKLKHELKIKAFILHNKLHCNKIKIKKQNKL